MMVNIALPIEVERSIFSDKEYMLIMQTRGSCQVAMTHLESGYLQCGSHEVVDMFKITLPELKKIVGGSSCTRIWDSQKKESYDG